MKWLNPFTVKGVNLQIRKKGKISWRNKKYSSRTCFSASSFHGSFSMLHRYQFAVVNVKRQKRKSNWYTSRVINKNENDSFWRKHSMIKQTDIYYGLREWCVLITHPSLTVTGITNWYRKQLVKMAAQQFYTNEKWQNGEENAGLPASPAGCYDNRAKRFF